MRPLSLLSQAPLHKGQGICPTDDDGTLDRHKLYLASRYLFASRATGTGSLIVFLAMENKINDSRKCSQPCLGKFYDTIAIKRRVPTIS